MPQSTPKPFKTYSQLVTIVESRGMLIEDSNRAERKLAQVGYYRLSGFSYPCRDFDRDSTGQVKICPKRKTPLRLNTFLPDTSFDKVFDLYLFDKQLRQIIIDAIERVEICLRSIIAHELSHNDPLAYEDAKFINPKWTQTFYPRPGQQRNSWLEWQSRHIRKINESREECILWHTKRGCPIPFWVVIEAWDFGTMSKYFEMLAGRYQNRIAAKFECSNPQEMIGWLKELNTLRNRCAHHSRVWNQKTSNTLTVTSVPRLQNLNLSENARSRLFGQIAVLWHLVNIIGPSSQWIQDVAKIIDSKPELPNCGFSNMGFANETGFPLHLFE